MIVKTTRLIPTKPQVHSRKLHLTYNACKVLPVSASVRAKTFCHPSFVFDSVNNEGALFFDLENGEEEVYEIVLYYNHNRACTIYRSWDDFRLLYQNIPLWRGAPRLENSGPGDVLAMHLFLKDAIVRWPKDVALEFFLRRRMGDCCAR